MYLLVKFCVNYLLCAIFKIPMILCDEFIGRAGTIAKFWVIFCGSQIIVSGKFWAAFPDYGPGKACVVTSSCALPCGEAPDALGVHRASPLGCGWGPSVITECILLRMII